MNTIATQKMPIRLDTPSDLLASAMGLPPIVRQPQKARGIMSQDPSSQSGELSPEEQALIAELVWDGLSIQETFHQEPLYNLTGKGTYVSETV